jgi:hypothetical protein
MEEAESRLGELLAYVKGADSPREWLVEMRDQCAEIRDLIRDGAAERVRESSTTGDSKGCVFCGSPRANTADDVGVSR